MALSNSTYVELLDPYPHNNDRSVFKLPYDYLSSWHLLDLGVYNTAIGDDTTIYYPNITGVLSCIYRMRLYSDSTEIGAVDEFQVQAALANLMTSNQGAEDINRFEKLNATNLALDYQGRYQISPDHKDYFQETSAGVQRYRNKFQISERATTGRSGMLYLGDFFPILKNHPVLVPIDNLYLEIEWNTAATNFQNGAGNFNVIRPTLYVEHVVGMPARPNQMTLDYVERVVETLNVPEAAVGNEVEVALRSSSLRGSYVKSLTYFNQVTTNSAGDAYLAAERSPAMYREKLQLKVNGKKYLPDDGITSEAMRMKYFIDTHQPLNLTLPASLPAIADGSGLIFSNDDQVGQFSVTAVRVEQVIDRLEVLHTRTGRGAGDQTLPFTLVQLADRLARIELDGSVTRKVY